MGSNAPLVSIGLATYNGARFLAKSLDSLLEQDYPNWELLISDNCSTDDTEAIALAYAGRSRRIRYVRQAANLGVIANFNFVLGQATGVYFMWAADHDLWDRTFISSCVRALEADPAAVLAYPQSLLIDADGTTIEEMDDQIELGQPRALDRYKHLIWRLSICNMIYGVARRDALVATAGFADVLAADRLVLARLALQGTVLRTGGHLYLRRRNRPPETPNEARRRQLADPDPSTATERAAMPAARLFGYLRDLHLAALRKAPLTRAQKLDGTMSTLACFHMRFHVVSRRVLAIKLLARLTGQTARLERQWGQRD